MPKVLTIYCIGTKHNYTENYNILVSLCDNTNAGAKILITHAGNITNYVGSATVDQTTPLTTNWNNQNQVCILVDGPNVDSLGGMFPDEEASANYIRTKANLVINLYYQYRPDSVNMVGHSRGGYLNLFIANQIFKNWVSNKQHICLYYNIFLIDPVNWTNLDPLDVSISPVISDYKRIVMEDEGNPQIVFPLETITSTAPSRPIQVLDNIRLPGTHGTASQLNPVTYQGDPIPSPKANQSLWPIADTAFKTICKQLLAWCTNMSIHFSDYEIINAYASIFINNPCIANGTNVMRLKNDCDESKTGNIQKVEYVQSNRDIAALNAIIPNQFRFGPIFINQQHHDLFARCFPNIGSYIDAPTYRPFFVSNNPYSATFTNLIDDLFRDLRSCSNEVRLLKLLCANMYNRFIHFHIIRE